MALNSAEWSDLQDRLVKRLGAKGGSLAVGRVSPLEETDEGFAVTAVLAQRDGEITTAGVAWPKRSFDAW
jgi:hypothetical protein